MTLGEMPQSDSPSLLARFVGKLSLKAVLTVPFTLQVLVAVGLVGYFSYRNGEQAVDDLAGQLIDKTSTQVSDYLHPYLDLPHQINQLNADAIYRGELPLNDRIQSNRYFWKQATVFPNLTFVGMINPAGHYNGAGHWMEGLGTVIVTPLEGNRHREYTTDAQGRPVIVLQTYEENASDDIWFQRTLKARRPIWNPVEQVEYEALELSPEAKALQARSSEPLIGFSKDDYVSISATYPVYDAQNQLLTVLGIDLQLTDISAFLENLQVSANGQVLILERDGGMVASSKPKSVLTRINNKTIRCNIFKPCGSLTPAFGTELKQRFGSLNQIQNSKKFEFQDQGHMSYVQLTPWRDPRGIDWLIVVLVPEQDFMARINHNTQTTILLSLSAFTVVVLLSLWTARWISSPIIRLGEASSKIAAGNLQETVEVNQVKELRTLAASFNQMAGQLQASFTELEASNVVLEERVADRTAELQAAKDAADKANRAKSDFLSQMSHELRTPLNGILGYAQILQRDPALLLKHQVGLRVIYQSGQHLLTLINDLLDLAKIEAGKLDLCPNEFHLEQFLQNLVDTCQVKAEVKEIQFRYHALTALPTAIFADEKRLRQVLLNLVGNATKFTEQGSVSLQVSSLTPTHLSPERLSPERLKFEVVDTGVGMTPAELERIFLPFEQGGDSWQRSEGTGLGLTITQQILTQMQSNLQVESTPGQGSRFWFVLNLPPVKNWHPVLITPTEVNICGYEGRRRRILIVDDRWENRTVLVNMLSPLGFDVVEAMHGGEGIRKAQQLSPDLIITDLVMPEVDGFQMTQAIRQIPALSQIPIIASSASVFKFSQQSQAAGCDYFLPKPLQLKEVLSLVQSALQLVWLYRQPEQELQKINPELASLTHPTAQDTDSSAGLVIPPAVELLRLQGFAKMGDVIEVKTELTRLQKLDPRYIPFVAQIQALVDEFDLVSIPSLLAQYHYREEIPH